MKITIECSTAEFPFWRHLIESELNEKEVPASSPKNDEQEPKKKVIAGSDLRTAIEILNEHKALICNVEDRMLSDFVYGLLPK